MFGGRHKAVTPLVRNAPPPLATKSTKNATRPARRQRSSPPLATKSTKTSPPPTPIPETDRESSGGAAEVEEACFFVRWETITRLKESPQDRQFRAMINAKVTLSPDGRGAGVRLPPIESGGGGDTVSEEGDDTVSEDDDEERSLCTVQQIIYILVVYYKYTQQSSSTEKKKEVNIYIYNKKSKCTLISLYTKNK